MKKGEEYWRVSDFQKYKVVYEDTLCFYLCLFKGSCSKVVNVSKSVKPFHVDFVATYKEVVELNIAKTKKTLANFEEDLHNTKLHL